MSKNPIPNISAVAALIADPARATMLTVLQDDIVLPAGELARLAKVSPQTASSHLAKLMKGGLISVTKSGRHRYYRLNNKDVARVIEALSVIAPPTRIRNLNDSLRNKAIHKARTCYDHLAGELGVGLTRAMVDNGLLQQHDLVYQVTDLGEEWLDGFGIYCSALKKTRRAFAPVCLDWSVRKGHIAGSLGAAIAERLFELQWIARIDESRAVQVTEAGLSGLQEMLGLGWV